MVENPKLGYTKITICGVFFLIDEELLSDPGWICKYFRLLLTGSAAEPFYQMFK